MSGRTIEQLAASLYGGADARPAEQTPTARTSEELANALYGNKPAPASAPAPVQPAAAPAANDKLTGPRTQDQIAESMYPTPPADAPLDPVPAEVAELRDDLARRMYSAQDTFKDAIPDSQFANVQEISAEHGAKAVREMREMAADVDMSADDVQLLRQRATFVYETKPDAIAQRESAIEVLNREFGDGAKQALRDARALIARDPRTAKLIEAMGVGDDPEVVVMMARAARRQRVSGKLKI